MSSRSASRHVNPPSTRTWRPTIRRGSQRSTARILARPLHLEGLETRQLLAADALLAAIDSVHVDPIETAPIDAEAGPIRLASVHGRKWSDVNGNGELDAGEPGLAGVTIYADLNRNGVLDPREPSTQSMRDIPATDFDESGLYHLAGLRPGTYLIREVVPDGFEQTFPPIQPPILDESDQVLGNDFATVDPERLVLKLAAGERHVEAVGVTVHPYCIRPIQVDVVASDPEIRLENLTGPQLNGCGGDSSKFRVAFEGDGYSHRFTLQFVDTLSQDPFAQIPVLIMAPRSGGAHTVVLSAGQSVDGLNFGNQRVRPTTGSIQGTKWLDANGNAERDPREPGLAGVTIYLDLNRNNLPDRDEPRTLTQRDDPQTDFDEAGRYRFDDVEPGTYAVREIVPDGSMQTYPQLILVDPLPPPGPLPLGASHVVTVRPGQQVDGVDFGNRPVQPGTIQGLKWLDRNGNGRREDHEPGLPGVTIYVDRNFNGRLDADEPRAVTMRDDLNTRVDESGRYSLENIRPGYISIREVVPAGYEQTFPRVPNDPPPQASVLPSRPIAYGGQHLVFLNSGETVDGIDFGNRLVDPAQVQGTKWLDRNGNGSRESREPGLAGITIYSDLNFNRRLDPDEPFTITMDDDPKTAIDETGRYWLTDLRPGQHLITEVLPDGQVRTFPPERNILAPYPISEPYFFTLQPGDRLRGIDFGNRPQELLGDFDHDGDVDAADIDLLGTAIRQFDMDPKFDLSGDGRVDLRDWIAMIKDVLETDFGDANLDRRFDSSDLVQVFAAGEYEDGIENNSGWAEGDWDADGDFDSSDLVVAFSDGGYVVGARGLAAAAVDAALADEQAPRRKGAWVA